MTLRQYWAQAREPRYSVLFVTPLLLLYEALAFLLSHSAFAGVRNGADVLLKTAFVALGGPRGLAAFGVALFGAGVWVVWRDWRRHPGPLAARVFALMAVESLAYASVFGLVVGRLTAFLLHPALRIAAGGVALPIQTQMVVSLGAGIYEELLFRVLLVSALIALGSAIKLPRPFAIGGAVVGSALIFSAFHYIGPLGDAFTLGSFAFRAVAGLLLSGLYVARGFGVTAWTHALYDVGLALLS
ncbi:MAG TPA: CPBP family glutamic-type intramembrane protease [Gemmatimonadales bacterium]|jgi:hypothetical protein